ncbi:MAG: cell division protein FtsQ/DivIB [Lentilitoribacter sp.]
MFSLIEKISDLKSSSASMAGGEQTFARRLLRPLIRRATRASADILSGHKKIPNHLGTFATLAFFTGVFSYGAVGGGHSEIALRTMTSAVGFAIEEIKVSGNVETSDIDILQELRLDETSSLLTLDLAKAHEQLSALPWVQHVELLKIYPATLHVKIEEREAFAIWQHGDQLSLIERDGDVIQNYDGVRNTNLPFFVGIGAESHASKMYDTLSNWPTFLSEAKAIIRVADRRWDLRLKNGVTLHLPEAGVDQALAHFKAFDEAQEVLRRDIAEVDLRIADRVTIRLTPEALERRKSALLERSKELKKREKS